MSGELPNDDPREEKRVVTETTAVVPSAPVERTVEETETVQRTETTSPPSDS